MTLTVAAALAVLHAVASAAPSAPQEPAVHAVMAEHATEVCAPSPEPATKETQDLCEKVSKLAAFVGFASGMQRVEVLIRWIELVRYGRGRCMTPAIEIKTPPTPDEVVAACDGVLSWLKRTDAAMTDDPARTDVAPSLFLYLASAHLARGEALAMLDGGLSPRACAAFADARATARRIDLSSWYAKARVREFREEIAKIEAAGAACP